MSNVPPSGEPSNIPPQGNFSAPPPEYAGYTRGGGSDPNQLQALADGYFGLNQVFLINVVMVIAINVATRSIFSWPLFIGCVVVVFAVITALTLPKNKLIGEGLGWGPNGPMIASILMGLNSALCCGIIGYAVVQNMAAKKMKEFGITGGTFGIKKNLVYARIEQLRAQQSMPSAPPPGL